MGSVVFRCPTIGMSVQGWIAEETSADPTGADFVGIACAACGQVHLVNAASGKVLGERREQRPED